MVPTFALALLIALGGLCTAVFFAGWYVGAQDEKMAQLERDRTAVVPYALNQSGEE